MRVGFTRVKGQWLGALYRNCYYCYYYGEIAMESSHDMWGMCPSDAGWQRVGESVGAVYAMTVMAVTALRCAALRAQQRVATLSYAQAKKRKK